MNIRKNATLCRLSGIDFDDPRQERTGQEGGAA